MILKNPQKGADLVEVNSKGYLWTFKVGDVWEFPNDVAEDLLNRFGFLQEVKRKPEPEVKEKLVEGEEIYYCSVCEYENKTKVAVVSHLKKHKGDKKEEIKKAEPVAEAVANPGLSQMRPTAKRSGNDEPTLGGDVPESGKTDKDGTSWYGEGYVEKRNVNERERPAGRFGAY